MSMKQSKEERELAIFSAFIEKAASVVIDSARNGDPSISEPDVVVALPGDQIFGVELTELCDENLASAIARPTTGAFWTSDPSARILMNKLHKTYSIEPVDLLIHWDGRVVTPDDVAIPTLKHQIAKAADRIAFRSIWYFGENTIERIWNRT